MKLTFDWNCVLAVKNEEAQMPAVQALIHAQRAGKADVAITAASASENIKTTIGEVKFPPNAGVFFETIKVLGWEDIPVLTIPMISGLSYIGLCHAVGNLEEFNKDFDRLWGVIAKNGVSREWTTYVQDPQVPDDTAIQSHELKKWRNSWCDVMTAYCHIQAKRDVFVTTNTGDFQKNAVRLSELGMLYICTPTEACDLLKLDLN